MSQTTAAAAAAQAGVSISTIRAWCRIGAVAAVKVAGKWLIEARSLTHRINLGRTPVPAPLTQVKGPVPSVDAIQAAAAAYEKARVDTNAAARAKKGALKTLDRTPDGSYGLVTVERFESSRLVADLDAIRELLELHGLGDVPMKTCAASLTITIAAEATGTTELAHAAA
jgi:hypothetical protein